MRRVDGGEKVTGLTRFAGDVQLSGMAHARLVLSPHAHARIVRIDAKTAAALPGVLAVFTAGDLRPPPAGPPQRAQAPPPPHPAPLPGPPGVGALPGAAAL